MSLKTTLSSQNIWNAYATVSVVTNSFKFEALPLQPPNPSIRDSPLGLGSKMDEPETNGFKIS